MSDHTLYVVLLAALACGVIAVLGALHWVIWLAEQQEGGKR